MKQLIINEEFKKHIWDIRPEEFDQLETNILKEGIRDKIITWNNIIIDGHNRYKIAIKHNLNFETIEKDFKDEDEVKDWMDANQTGRRNLTTEQWQISVGRRYIREKQKQGGTGANQYKEQSAKVWHSANDLTVASVKTAVKLADEYKVAPTTIRNYAKKAIEFDALEKNEPELYKQVQAGTKTITEAKKDILKKEISKKIEVLKNKKVDSINKKYDVIVIDPAWEMKKIDRDVAPNQTDFDYPTMTIEEIKNFKLPAEDNCHLFLWTTQKYLKESFSILEFWGFKYVLTMVWHKNGGFQPFGLPQYNCEFILYARKGTPIFVDTKDFFTCFNAKRTGHSAKPEEFYDLVRRVTAGTKIDIFNRRKIDGFDTYGNEANG